MQSMGGLNAAIEQREESIRQETRDADRVNTLRENIATLQTKLKEAEETIRSQNSEINNLKTNVEILVKQVRKLALPNNQAKPEAAGDTKNTEEIMESASTTIAGLEAQIRDMQEVVRGKECAIAVLEQNLSVKIQDLETQLSKKEDLLPDRDKKMTDVQSERKTAISRTKKVSPAASEAKPPAGSAAQNLGTVTANPLNREKNNLPSAPFSRPAVRSVAAEVSIVPRALFDRMARELTRIVGPLAIKIVHHDVAALGESIDAFPRRRLAELLNLVTKEVADENVRRAFCERIIKQV